MIETGTLLQGRYLIEKKIGSGGMGAVYLATDQRFDNYVAIKETLYKDEELGEAFEREAKLLNALQHSVLPHVSDYFAENNNYFLVMQYIEGEDLTDILKREGAFPLEDVMRWTDQMLDALDYLHSQEPPIIHRDIKPHNLKLTPRGDIMLLDFGLAKLNYDDTTGAISVFGYSRTYSPLEQIQGTGTDARSDIFALGATVYHLLTGQPPVDALTRAAAIVNGNQDPLPLASEIKPEIPIAAASLINSALALNPQNRFISAAAMRQALANAVNEISSDETAAKTPQQAMTSASAPLLADSSENENFAALDAFAVEAWNNSAAFGQQSGEDIKPAEAAVLPPVEQASHAPIIIETTSGVTNSSELTGRRAAAAALAAMLIFGLVFAGWFMSGREKTGERTDQAPVTEPAPAPESRADVSEKLSAKESSEKSGQTKPKQESIEDASQNRSVDESGAEEPLAEREQNEDQPNRSNQSRDQSDETGNAETRERVIENPKVVDASEAESILKGRSANREDNVRSQNDEQIPEVMTEEEFERLRQERKKRRQERRRKPNPF